MSELEQARQQLARDPKAFMAEGGWNWRCEAKALTLEGKARDLRATPGDDDVEAKLCELEAKEWRALLRNR